MSKPNPVPVLCDRCRAAGHAGESPFAHLGDLLDFEPVPRRPRIGGWTPDVQRAFIAALAATGSARRAAAAVNRAQYGVVQLLNAKGSASFAAAYARAMEMAEADERERLAEGVSATLRTAADAWPSLPAPLDPGQPSAAPPEPATLQGDEQERLLAESLHRAIHGVEVPIFHGGRQVGARRVYNEQLAMFHLRTGGAAAEAAPARDAITDPREVRLHRLMKDNPHWNRAFAETALRHPHSLYRASREPWNFGRIGSVIDLLRHFHAAFDDFVAGDPALQAAYDLLFSERSDLVTHDEILGHAVAIMVCFIPGGGRLLADQIEEMVRDIAEERRRQAATPRLPPPGGEEGDDL